MALNPVEQRLVELRDHWEEFRSDPVKRILVWQVLDNAVRMLQCFFEAQKHESEYSTDDLFIVFNAPFENSIQYSRILKEELAGQYEASRADLQQEGVAADWKFDPSDFADSAGGFIQSLRSFGSKHHKIINHLVAVLMPQGVANNDAYISWISRALRAGLPERLRLAVIDSSEHPRLNKLIETNRDLVHLDTPKIDALTVAQETFAQETTSGPGGVFRNHLMSLVTLVEKGSINQVKAKAADAFAFARKQKWADQEVVIRMLFAGALLKEKRFEEAVKVYQGARRSASQAVKSNHPAAQQLILQTWFGEAGAHFAAGDLYHATDSYAQAAAVAGQIPNPILEIEAYRMSAFCHGRSGQRDAALERGAKVFECARRLKPEARTLTTAPLAAIDLLRVVDAGRVQSMEDIKHRYETHIKQSNEELEQRAVELESTGTAYQQEKIEEKFASETAQAKREASAALISSAEAGEEKFREIFWQARQLLGEHWPFSTLAAAPFPGEIAMAGSDEGAAAT